VAEGVKKAGTPVKHTCCDFKKAFVLGRFFNAMARKKRKTGRESKRIPAVENLIQSWHSEKNRPLPEKKWSADK
jgi:hypothetical protein